LDLSNGRSDEFIFFNMLVAIFYTIHCIILIIHE